MQCTMKSTIIVHRTILQVRSSFRSLRLHRDAPDALERSSRLRQDDLAGVPLFNEAPEDKHDEADAEHANIAKRSCRLLHDCDSERLKLELS